MGRFSTEAIDIFIP